MPKGSLNTPSTKSLTEQHVVIYKVGGSLFTLPNLATRIRDIASQRPGTKPLLIAGGGSTANLVRQWDRIHNLGEERSHWLALKSLRLNQALLLDLLPDAIVVSDKKDAIRAWENGTLPIADAHEFLSAAESCGNRLPHCWDVTSDSIAAWLALRLEASELILLKSTSMPEQGTVHTAIDLELVDPYFPQLADQVRRISWVNLRSDQPKIEAWRF